MTKTVLAAVMGVFIATSAAADPNPQLVRSIEIRLAQYGLAADVSQFATSTVARLHLTLNSTEDWIDIRRKLVWILKNPKYK